MTVHDIVVRNGEIHDGMASEPVVGSIAITGDRITAIGDVKGTGKEEIDAKGYIVTPGFVDIHTHFDAQCTWENTLAPSSLHGVTTVVMGNCGVGFAPCRASERDLMIRLMEGIEDIPEAVLSEGLPWAWESFPEYLDWLSTRHFDLDLLAQLPHSALRVYVMGDRAADEHATADDLRRMRALTRQAVEAGAIGVSTSRFHFHRTKAGELAPSLHSRDAELLELASGLRDAGKGVFQLIPRVDEDAASEFALIREIARASGRPVSFSLAARGDKGPGWLELPRLMECAKAEGLQIRGQVAPRPIGILFGLDLSFHPFALHPSFRPIADLHLAEKVAALRNPALRARLLSEKPEHPNPISIHFVERGIHSYRMTDPPNYEPDLATRMDRLASAAGKPVLEHIYDVLLEDEGRSILYAPSGYDARTIPIVRKLLNEPMTVIGLSDGGAHCGLICDASFPTWLLMRWARDGVGSDRIPLPSAVAELTSKPAEAVGLLDRGRIAAGCKADLNIIDLDRLSLSRPLVRRDLPAGGKRLHQAAGGYRMTLKSGQVTYRDGVASGSLPGRLVRGAQDAPRANAS